MEDHLGQVFERNFGGRDVERVRDQLKSIKDKIAGKEKELLELCGHDNRLDLTEKIKNFIQFGIDLNAKDNGGRNALHLMCRNYSSPKLTDAIKLLIENKTDVNAKDNDGLNAIHFLCRYHSSQNLIKAIQILIQSGIDAKATTNDGSNALHYLCRYNASPNLTDAVTIFTDLGMNLMTKDDSGWSAFYYLQNKDKKEMKIFFDRDALLGRGGFAAVFKGKFGGREVAVKRVELHKVDEREEEAMLKLKHPNIVKLLHCEKDNHFMYYALELCVASLDQLFLESNPSKKYDGPIPRQILVFSQLASGLEHIHLKKLIHRDIKPSNILIMKSPGKNEEIIIKWSDFGLAKSVNEKGLHSWSGVRGTRTWYAPEVLEKLINGERAEQEEFWGTVQSDVFVLGLVFGYLFLKGEHLYGSSENEIHKNIIEKDPVNMKNINCELRKYYEDDLLKKMLEHNPKKRITSKEVVKQLESINNKLTEKEEELRQLCARDSSSGLIEKINDLIQLGIDVNAKDIFGQNALHFLCRFNSNSNLLDAIRLLIQLEIDVNEKDNDGENALHYLCKNKSNSNLIDAIRLLIQLGVDVNEKDNDGWNALHFLCEFNSNSNLLDAIRLLIQLGINVNAKSKYGKNALHFLGRFNSNSNLTDAIQLLIQLGIDVNEKDNDGWNALHYLCRYNSNSNLLDAIRLLIQLRIDINSKDKNGWNALHLLCKCNSNSNLLDAIRLLIQLGIDANAKNKSRWNALHILCIYNANSNLIDAIQLFIQLGIPVVSDGNDARYFLRSYNRIKNTDEILKLLDEAALV
ncbi:ankyrin repeat and protein kinase domain-containing protein 1 isoform X1 [Daphnia magna]|uniref:ankyrin repeat and protein kinase domain-containing protein 1 isoform X1 n=1 Tax=Daphnia magna TaxID=35525 RepID=UPI001E1BB943|nr:ankyrin repeat and protein kinase domain-containing protein 1 isoform X1 [Daphnia magna]